MILALKRTFWSQNRLNIYNQRITTSVSILDTNLWSNAHSLMINVSILLVIFIWLFRSIMFILSSIFLTHLSCSTQAVVYKNFFLIILLYFYFFTIFFFPSWSVKLTLTHQSLAHKLKSTFTSNWEKSIQMTCWVIWFIKFPSEKHKIR